MRLRWLLFPTILSLLVAMILACARSGGNPGTTTVAPANCPTRTDAALLAGTFTSASDFWGEVAPVGTCDTCAAGEASYYPDSGIVSPSAADQKAIGGLTCANLCLCSADGTCYTRTDQNVNVVLYPYCNAGVCSVYAIIVAQDQNAGLVSSTGTTFTAGQQIDPVTLDRVPVTSGNYPEITYASCSGCSTQTTC